MGRHSPASPPLLRGESSIRHSKDVVFYCVRLKLLLMLCKCLCHCDTFAAVLICLTSGWLTAISSSSESTDPLIIVLSMQASVQDSGKKWTRSESHHHPGSARGGGGGPLLYWGHSSDAWFLFCGENFYAIKTVSKCVLYVAYLRNG